MSHRTERDGPLDSGYDEWIDAVGAGDGYYLECGEGHGSLPPRRSCPHCGDPDLEERPLPETGEVDTYTVMHVAGPRFADDVPYVTAIASFGPVRLTGVLDVDPDEADVGLPVSAGVGRDETTGDRLLSLTPK